MRTRRQNIQLELALEPVAKGEARNPDTQGTEARTAHAEPAPTLRYGPMGDPAPTLRLKALAWPKG